MVKGAVPNFVDGTYLDGDEFAWILELRELSNPEFQYPENHPCRGIRSELAAVQLTHVVHSAIQKHRKSISRLKETERDCQRLAVNCMLADAYETGALELLTFGLERGRVSAEDDAYVSSQIAARRLRGWCRAAGECAELLEKIRTKLRIKGTKSRPLMGDDFGSIQAQTDNMMIHDINARIPSFIDRKSDEYWAKMFDGVVPEVRRYIREGRLPNGFDQSAGADLQSVVDKHARRARKRLLAIKQKFLNS